MNDEFLNIVLKAFLAIIGALLTYYIIPYIKGKIGEAQYEKLQAYTEYAVRGAEQLYTPEQWKEKKRHVYNYILEKSKEIGVDMEPPDIDLLVEGVVNLVKHGGN